MSYSVVIPSNVADKLRLAVASILEKHPALPPEKIVVVDDGARAEWRDSDPRVTWVEGVRPFIYARNVNRGIAAVDKNDDVIIMGDDVKVLTSGAFDKLAIAARCRCYAVSPGVTGVVGNPLQQRRADGVSTESPFELCFICVYITRHALDAVGLLDERFVGYGFEDTDWCYRAQQMGGRLFVDHSVGVLHNDIDMPSAFRDDAGVHAKAILARTIFVKKWPQHPRIR